MGKRFKGDETTYSYANVDARVRVYKKADGNLEKVVIIDGKRNLVFTPETLAIASYVARDLQPFLACSCEGFVADDPISDRIRRDVLPMITGRATCDPRLGWKIPAIKKYREIAKSGLKDAKEAVEFIELHGFDYFLNKMWPQYKEANPWLFRQDEEPQEMYGK